MHYSLDVIPGAMPIYDVSQPSTVSYWDKGTVREDKVSNRAHVPLQELKIRTYSPREAATYFVNQIEQGIAVLNAKIAQTEGKQDQILLPITQPPTLSHPNLWFMVYGIMAYQINPDTQSYLGSEELKLGNPKRIAEIYKRGIFKRMNQVLFMGK